MSMDDGKVFDEIFSSSIATIVISFLIFMFVLMYGLLRPEISGQFGGSADSLWNAVLVSYNLSQLVSSIEMFIFGIMILIGVSAVGYKLR